MLSEILTVMNHRCVIHHTMMRPEKEHQGEVCGIRSNNKTRELPPTLSKYPTTSAPRSSCEKQCKERLKVLITRMVTLGQVPATMTIEVSLIKAAMRRTECLCR
jgi:hypothetical protein